MVQPQIIIEKEMGLTHKDFFRTISNAIGDSRIQINKSGVTLKTKKKKLQIKLSPQRKREIGSLIFPITDVVLYFDGYSSSEIKSVIKRFDLRFKRGGG